MAQRLKPPYGVGVVVRVALQMESGPVGEHMVAVPGVLWLAGLVSAIGIFFPQESVVLNIVGRGELKVRPQGCWQQKQQHLRAQPHTQPDPQGQRNLRRLDDFIVQ